MSLHLGQQQVGLHTYGILIACGFAVGIALAFREAGRRGLDGGKILDLSFWILVTGLIGSRIFYVAINAGDFARACTGDGDVTARPLSAAIWDCTRALHVWEGGLVFYGGFLAAGATALLFARRQRWSFWTVGDIFAPALAIGHAFGRLGCFAAGCCFGKVAAAGVRWSASFPPDSVAFEELHAVGALAPGAQMTPPLFPTQLYEAAGELLIFLVLLAVRRRPGVAGKPGTLLLLYAIMYGVLRFTDEMFRGDFARRYLFELAIPGLARWLGMPPGEPVLLSYGQLVSVAIVIGGAAVLFARGARARGTQETTAAPGNKGLVSPP
jgi:phosphatidylglycerol:prolipoprotein diacylglycerol transferase